MHALRTSLLVLIVAALLAPVSSAQAQPSPRIINGTAPTRAWPAQTSVRFTITSGTYVCGGTLVSARWVLTAGHCATNDSGAVPPASAYVLNIGGTTRTNGSAATVDQVLRDPSYTATGVPRFDVALLHLTSAATQESLPFVTTAETALWTPPVQATIIGWGVTETGSQATTLREAQTPMVSDASCSSSWGSSNFAASVMVCAGGGGTDTCGGDSGGPLMVPRAGWFAVAGVTSWGSSSCGSPGLPGVYARLGAAAINDWVSSLVPTVQLTSSPAAPLNGEPVSLTATVSNAGQAAAPALTWDTDDDGAFDDASGPNASVTFATAGSHVVRVRSDYAGATGDRGLARAVVVTTSAASEPPPPEQAAPPLDETGSPAAAAANVPAAVVANVPTAPTNIAPAPRPSVALPAGDRIDAPRTIRFRTLRSRNLRVSFRCTAACSISGRLTLAAGSARRFGLGDGTHSVTIGRGRAARGSAGRGVLVVTLTARARRALRNREHATLTLATELLVGAGRHDATRTIGARR